jgi:thiamine kinase-like enzyme
VNEIKLLTNQSDIIYIDNSIMIKKWVPGHHLNTNDINTLKNIKLSLNQHWNTKIDGITFFDNATNVKDIVLSHGDLRPQNIIVNDYQDIVLIDFEWTNYNSKYFDLSHLYLYCSFAIDDIVSVFNVDKEKLLKAVINVRKFNTNWEKKEYKKNLD